MPTASGKEAKSTAAYDDAAAVAAANATGSKSTAKSNVSTSSSAAAKTPQLTGGTDTSKKVVSKSITTLSSSQNATDTSATDDGAAGGASLRRPSLKFRPNPNLPSDVSDMDVSTIPPLEDISEELWNQCTNLRRFVIMTRYGYTEMDRFEKYALQFHPQEELGNSRPQWTLFSPYMPCPDFGMYIVKLPYINGTYLVLFGISVAGIAIGSTFRAGSYGLYNRIKAHHVSNGVVGEVITIAGDMRGGIKLFEDAMKVHFRPLVPKVEVIGGEDIYIHGHETLLVPSSVVADTIALTIVDWSKTYKSTGSLSIPACFGNPSGATISLDENAKDFVRNHPVNKKINNKINPERVGKRVDERVGELVRFINAGLEKFQALHPGKRPCIYDTNHPLYTLSNQIVYDLKRYQGKFSCRLNPLDQRILESYRKYNLIEFQLSPEESVTSEQSSKVYKKDFKEGDGSERVQEPEAPALPRAEAPQAVEEIVTRSGRKGRATANYGACEEVELEDSQGCEDAGLESSQGSSEGKCVCSKVHSQPHYWVGCDECRLWFHVKCTCTGYTKKNMDLMDSYTCPTCDAKRPTYTSLPDVSDEVQRFFDKKKQYRDQRKCGQDDKEEEKVGGGEDEVASLPTKKRQKTEAKTSENEVPFVVTKCVSVVASVMNSNKSSEELRNGGRDDIKDIVRPTLTFGNKFWKQIKVLLDKAIDAKEKGKTVDHDNLLRMFYASNPKTKPKATQTKNKAQQKRSKKKKKRLEEKVPSLLPNKKRQKTSSEVSNLDTKLPAKAMPSEVSNLDTKLPAKAMPSEVSNLDTKLPAKEDDGEEL